MTWHLPAIAVTFSFVFVGFVSSEIGVLFDSMPNGDGWHSVTLRVGDESRDVSDRIAFIGDGEEQQGLHMCFLDDYEKSYEAKMAAISATSRGRSAGAKPVPDPANIYSPVVEIPQWVFDQFGTDSVKIYVNISFTIVRCTKPGCSGDFFTLWHRQVRNEADLNENLLPIEGGPLNAGFGKLLNNGLPDGDDVRNYVTEERRHFVVNRSENSNPIRFVVVVQEQGACVGLVRLKIYYQFCPDINVGLLRFPQTVPVARSLSGFYGSKVQGSCGDNSQYNMASLAAPPALICNPNGEWVDYSRRVLVSGGNEDQFCQCSPGSELVTISDHLQCSECPLDTFKPGLGPGPCSKCPANSNAPSMGSQICGCDLGFFRAPTDSIASTCTKPPSAPRNLVGRTVNQTAVTLSWEEPLYPGERRDEAVTYRVECLGCSNLVRFVPSSTSIGGKEVTIVELYPGRFYNFTVFAENNVSSIASEANNFQTTAVTTMDGYRSVTSSLQFISFLPRYQDNSGVSLRWQVVDDIQSSELPATIDRFEIHFARESNRLEVVEWNCSLGGISLQRDREACQLARNTEQYRLMGCEAICNITGLAFDELYEFKLRAALIFPDGENEQKVTLTQFSSPLIVRTPVFVAPTSAVGALTNPIFVGSAIGIAIICSIGFVVLLFYMSRRRAHLSGGGSSRKGLISNYVDKAECEFFKPYLTGRVLENSDNSHGSSSATNSTHFTSPPLLSKQNSDQNQNTDPSDPFLPVTSSKLSSFAPSSFLNSLPPVITKVYDHYRSSSKPRSSSVSHQRGPSNCEFVDPHTYDDPTIAVRAFAREIDPGCIRIDAVIGGGEFGEVCRGELRLPGKPPQTVAIKTLKPGAAERDRISFLMETSIMAQFDNPNIVSLQGVITRCEPVMIVTEFLENGSLDVFLRDNLGELTVVQLTTMMLNIASGMTYLASLDVVHRDLAARNVLVSSRPSLVCKVADFGLARKLVHANSFDETSHSGGVYQTSGGKIPVRWTAPEAILYRKFKPSSDVWSFGVVMWEIVSFGERPYWNWTNQDVVKAVEGGFRLPPPSSCPEVLYALMLDCWQMDPARRPKFSKIVTIIQKVLRNPDLLRPVCEPSLPSPVGLGQSGFATLPARFSGAAMVQQSLSVPDLSSFRSLDDFLRFMDLPHFTTPFLARGIATIAQAVCMTEHELSLVVANSSAADRVRFIHYTDLLRPQLQFKPPAINV